MTTPAGAPMTNATVICAHQTLYTPASGALTIQAGLRRVTIPFSFSAIEFTTQQLQATVNTGLVTSLKLCFSEITRSRKNSARKV
jgi:hypothetical protein